MEPGQRLLSKYATRHCDLSDVIKRLEIVEKYVKDEDKAGDEEIYAVVKFSVKHYSEYLALFNKLDKTRFKSNGSIVSMVDCTPWHDYTLKRKDRQDF
jgi:hypothetical protein